MKKIQFFKMHGAGNDFVCIDNVDGKTTLNPEEIIFLCDRHIGVGADGVILMEKSKDAAGDIFMNYWNADGTAAEMCGNGARCTADFAIRFWGLKKDIINVSTRSGVKTIEILDNGLFTVNMGKPDFEKYADFPNQKQKFGEIEFNFVSMGNPHAVGLYESEQEMERDFLVLGKDIESNTTYFPNKINVNFITKKENAGENHFTAKTFERGVGPTLACGTGMCGSFAVLSQKLNKINTKEKTHIDIPGGTLYFEFNNTGEILMTGSSAFVFTGEIDIDSF